MTREEEIENEVNKRLLTEWWVNTPYTEDIKESLIHIAKWADAHPHWISVEDELPKKGEIVLGYSQQVNTIITTPYNDKGFEYFYNYAVTHWMPLPAPPRKDEDNSKFEENCERYRKIFVGWDKLSWAEKRDRINNFRCGG